MGVVSTLFTLKQTSGDSSWAPGRGPPSAVPHLPCDLTCSRGCDSVPTRRGRWLSRGQTPIRTEASHEVLSEDPGGGDELRRAATPPGRPGDSKAEVASRVPVGMSPICAWNELFGLRTTFLVSSLARVSRKRQKQ